MSNRYDTIVLGLGAMGSAVAYHLAKRGARVLGLDANQPPHQVGSSGGHSRMFRLAYFEHPDYVPLLQRS
ncbi:MAG: FAD-dependent oxidoreductase, partial [Planctomycetota bacterium]